MQQPAGQSPSQPYSPTDRISRSVWGQVRQTIAVQNWLDPIGDAVNRFVNRLLTPIYPGGTDLLHGRWLGHPLHPVLTDVPVGAATAAMFIDTVNLATGGAALGRCSTAALMVGTAAAVPTAVAGATDWSHVDGYPRRVGLVHATMNLLAIGLNVASIVARLRGNRTRGVALSTTGYMLSTSAAWLGGQLVYEEMIGVDHTATLEGPREFVAVMRESDLPQGRLHKVAAGGVPVLLLRRGAEIFAIAETCSHQGGPLSEGKLIEDTVVCPLHGSQYRLWDGTVMHGPSVFDQPCFETRIWNGQIWVRRNPAVR